MIFIIKKLLNYVKGEKWKFVASLLFGFILGNIASTLANAEIRRVKYEEKLDAIQVCNRLLVSRREWQIRGQC